MPLENSIAWLTCAFASRQGAVMVGWPGAAQDRLLLVRRILNVDSQQICRKPVLGGLINECTHAA